MLAATKRFPPVGRCIYCDREDGLRDEHIIPFGLGGQLILPEASCKKCADVTSSLEGRLLRGHWWPHRRRLGLQTRRPNEQPQSFPATIEASEGSSTVEVLADEYPVLVVFDFDPPSYLRGQATVGPPYAPRMFVKSTSQAPPVIPNDKKITFPVNLNVDDFVRFLAKIGLSWAVGVRGLSAFEAIYVRDLISGNTDGATTYIGSASSPLLGPTLPGLELHVIMDRVHGQDLSVYVQLFRDAGDPPPIYEVVVGRLRHTSVTEDDARLVGVATNLLCA